MADIQRWTVTEPYLHLDCGLGEAPFYEEAGHRLRFVDIVKKKLHVVDLHKGPSSLVTVDLQDSVGAPPGARITADVDGAEGDEIMVGAKYGYAIVNRTTGAMQYLRKFSEDPEQGKRMRSNDGAVDTSGRFWVGTMNDPAITDPTDVGVVFRLDPDLTLHRMIEKVTIPNSIGWSADDTTMFFTDSPTKTISRFDYDAASGSISNRRPYFTYEGDEEGAAPDGFALDVEGCLWTAVYGTGKVLRVSPEGKLIGEIRLPTRCVTCPRFAGEDLFITSAAEEDPKAHPESAKYGGSVFQVHVGVQGMPIRKWKR
ncbi:hypothetical protein MMC26_001418 [Xylographa opegraphella]|nr:hypothetical protein [Xylographa opegraphella]